MEYRTVTAKTLEDAITKAQVELGVTSDRLDYKVIEKGSEGFLGIGRKQAVIEARIKEEPKPVVEEKKAEPVVEERKAVDSTVSAKKAEEPKTEEVKEFKEAKEFKEEKKSYKENKKYDKKYNKSRDKYNKKDRNRREKNYKSDDYKNTKPVEEAPVEKKEIVLAEVLPETKETCKKFIIDVLAAMDMQDVVVTESIDEEGALCISMEGPNMGILIGKRGQTLDSLQYLTNRVANKMQEGYVRVKLDTENYRNKRKKTLENLAKNIAGRVKRTRRAVALEPMNPYERRIIHSALQNDPAVSTHSEGEEPYRKVVVTLNRR